MKTLDKKIKKFILTEQAIVKKMKNLIIECIESSFLSPTQLKIGKEYDIWSTSPTCTLRWQCVDKILEIEKELSYYEEGEIVDYNIYVKRGRLGYIGISDKQLKEKLLIKFKKYNLNFIIAKEIINYLYSGKMVSTFDHITWEEAKKESIN